MCGCTMRYCVYKHSSLDVSFKNCSTIISDCHILMHGIPGYPQLQLWSARVRRIRPRTEAQRRPDTHDMMTCTRSSKDVVRGRMSVWSHRYSMVLYALRITIRNITCMFTASLRVLVCFDRTQCLYQGCACIAASHRWTCRFGLQKELSLQKIVEVLGDL